MINNFWLVMSLMVFFIFNHFHKMDNEIVLTNTFLDYCQFFMMIYAESIN